MAYTYDQLVQAYTAVHDGVAPDANTLAMFQVQAVQSANGQLSDAQLMGNIINTADSTTGLAVLAYQFFTGKSPTKAGIDYLVNSSVNTSDLNDPYYSKFSLENRYINFAANLGVQGEGAANFSAKYGAMSYGDYVASIYQTIIGGSYASAAGIDPTAAIANIISRKDAILATAQSAGMIPANATAAQIDIALKAATAGYLLGEAIKADVGLYAAAADNFLVAVAQGTATYNTDITISYAPNVNSAAHGTGHAVDRGPTNVPGTTTTTPPVTTPVTHSFTLTAGTDHITATAQDDTFTATNATLTAGDTLNGGGGNDVLNFTLSSGLYTLPAVTVSSIETVNVSVTGTFRAYNWSGWTGMTSLNLTGVGVAVMDTQSIPTSANVTVGGAVYGGNSTTISGGHNINVTVTSDAGNGSLEVDSNTGDTHITRTNTGAGTHGNISVNGTGGNAYITQVADLTGIALGSSQANGTVGFGGSATSTSVEIVNPTPVAATVGTVGITGGGVSVFDYNTDGGHGLGTLTTIKVDGFAGAYLESNALTSLTLSNGSGNVQIDNQGSLPVGHATSLNATLNSVSLSTFTDNNWASYYTTLAFATGSTASSITTLDFRAATQLTVSGSGSLTLTSIANATQLHTATVTGAASLTATFGAGNDTITLGAGASTINTGAGTDNVIVTAANTHSDTTYSTLTVSPGDTLKINAQGAAAAFTGTMAAAPVTGTTFQTYLDAAAAGDGHTTSAWNWFQFGGDTYIVLDSSAAATFQAGTDIVVKLVGAFNEGNANITAGVLTIQ